MTTQLTKLQRQYMGKIAKEKYLVQMKDKIQKALVEEQEKEEKDTKKISDLQTKLKSVIIDEEGQNFAQVKLNRITDAHNIMMKKRIEKRRIKNKMGKATRKLNRRRR